MIKKKKIFNHKFTNICNNNINNTYIKRYRFTEAQQQLEQEALELLRTGDSITQYDTTGALKLFEKSLTIFEELYGRNHINTLIVLNRIALSTESLDNHVEAEKLYREVLEGSIKRLGEKHTMTTVAYVNVAANMIKQNKLPDSLPFLERVYKVRQDSLGDAHIDTVNVIIDLADVNMKLGKNKEAQRLLEKAIKITNAELIDEELRSRILHLYINLQKTLGNLESEGDFPLLESTLIELLGSMEVLDGATSNSLIPYLETLASFYKVRNPKVVPTLLERVCDIQKANNATLKDRIDGYLNVANSYQNFPEESSRAVFFYKVAIKLADQYFGPTNSQTSLIINRLVEYHTNRKEFALAIEVLQDLLGRMKEVNQEFCSSIKFHIGDCYFQMENYDDSQTYLKESLQTLESVNPKSTYLPAILYLLGIINHKLKNNELAVDYFKRAKDIMEVVPQQNQEMQHALTQKIEDLDKFLGKK